jgi:hypothetical protein
VTLVQLDQIHRAFQGCRQQAHGLEEGLGIHALHGEIHVGILLEMARTG